MDPSNEVVSTDLALDRVAGNLHIQKTIHLAYILGTESTAGEKT